MLLLSAESEGYRGAFFKAKIGVAAKMVSLVFKLTCPFLVVLDNEQSVFKA